MIKICPHGAVCLLLGAKYMYMTIIYSNIFSLEIAFSGPIYLYQVSVYRTIGPLVLIFAAAEEERKEGYTL